jgi:hypothetical protein
MEIRKPSLAPDRMGTLTGSDGAQNHDVAVADVLRRGFAVGSRPDGES